jgi:hypothetical protein
MKRKCSKRQEIYQQSAIQPILSGGVKSKELSKGRGKIGIVCVAGNGRHWLRSGCEGDEKQEEKRGADRHGRIMLANSGGAVAHCSSIQATWSDQNMTQLLLESDRR